MINWVKLQDSALAAGIIAGGACLGVHLGAKGMSFGWQATGSLLGNLAGNTIFAVVSGLRERRLHDAYVAYDLKNNHHVLIAFRAAQREAVRDVLNAYNDQYSRDSFSEALMRYVTQPDAVKPFDAIDVEDQLAVMQDAVNAALADQATPAHFPGWISADHRNDYAALIRSGDALREAAENALVAEFAAGCKFPDGIDIAHNTNFQTMFRSKENGWFQYFAAGVIARLKDEKHAEFLKAHSASQLALLNRRAEAAQLCLDLLLERTDAVSAWLNAEAEPPIQGRVAVSKDSWLRFSYKNDDIPFIGREAEIEAITGFLNHPEQKALWWLVTGGGGAGKSRLALEICDRCVRGDITSPNGRFWRAGFLMDGATVDKAKLKQWQPRMPTLIVVDYSLKKAGSVRDYIFTLHGRSDLAHPVRFLLLEREEKLAFELGFLADSGSGEIKAARWPNPTLGLAEAGKGLSEDELWEITRPFRNAAVDKAEFSQKLQQIDPAQRALSALLLADVMSRPGNPADFSTLSIEKVLDRLLDHERNTWPVAADKSPLARADYEEVAIALATMVRGYSIDEEFSRLPLEAQRLFAELRMDVCDAMALVRSDQTAERQPADIGWIEPDLIGEYFALEAIGRRKGATPARRFPWIPEAAWRLDGDRMSDFVLRAQQNFPHHKSIDACVIDVPDNLANRMSLAILKFTRVVEETGEITAGIRAATDFLKPLAPRDLAAARAFSEFTLYSTTEAENIELSRGLLDALSELMGAHPTEAALRELWAKSAANYIGRTAASAPEVARGLLDALSELMGAHPTEAALRELWAKSVTNYIGRTAASAPEVARGLLDALSELMGAHPTEAALREQWATSAANYIFDTAASAPEVARGLLDALSELMGAHPTEAALREQWATSAANYIGRTAASAPEVARGLLDALSELMGAHPTEAALREQWATSAANYIFDTAASAPEVARGLLDALSELMGAHPTEAALREQWAKSAANYIFGTAASAPEVARGLLDALSELMGAHPTEAALREQWAKSVTNYIADTAASAPEVARGLLDALSELMGAHPTEAALRELWATSVTNYIGRTAASAPEVARGLLDALSELMGAHPTEAALREQWATSAANYIFDTAASAPEVARGLLDALSELMGAHPTEAALREQWATSAANYIFGTAQTDPENAVSLANQVIEVANGNPAEEILGEVVVRLIESLRDIGIIGNE